MKVTGAVNSPGSVLWQKSKGLDYYISAAGGFAFRADKGRVSVKYANGEVRTRRKSLLISSTPKPGPGSEVFVPVRDTTERTNYVQLFGAIAQIIASAVPTYRAKYGSATYRATAAFRISSPGRTSWNGTSTIAIIVLATK